VFVPNVVVEENVGACSVVAVDVEQFASGSFVGLPLVPVVTDEETAIGTFSETVEVDLDFVVAVEDCDCFVPLVVAQFGGT